MEKAVCQCASQIRAMVLGNKTIFYIINGVVENSSNGGFGLAVYLKGFIGWLTSESG